MRGEKFWCTLYCRNQCGKFVSKIGREWIYISYIVWFVWVCACGISVSSIRGNNVSAHSCDDSLKWLYMKWQKKKLFILRGNLLKQNKHNDRAIIIKLSINWIWFGSKTKKNVWKERWWKTKCKYVCERICKRDSRPYSVGAGAAATIEHCQCKVIFCIGNPIQSNIICLWTTKSQILLYLFEMHNAFSFTFHTTVPNAADQFIRFIITRICFTQND